MKQELFARLSRRYLALDIHKHYSVVAGVNFEGEVILEPVRVEHADLAVWLEKHIQRSDYVVIESTTNAWYVAHRHHLSHPKGKRFNEKNTAWQQDDELSDEEKFQLELDRSTEKHLSEQAGKITKKLAKMSHEKPWAESMMYLMQLPGFGVVTGMTILAAIGEITRFEDFKKLSSSRPNNRPWRFPFDWQTPARKWRVGAWRAVSERGI